MQLDSLIKRIEQQAPAHVFDLTLKRLAPIVEHYQLNHWSCPCIMVAGTNGKGSVVASCQALAKAYGHKLAAITSPHLHKLNERFYFDGQCIEDDALADLLSWVLPIQYEYQLTYYETMVIAGLQYFKSCQPDIMVLEIGLGGELDAVNCVDADISVFTSIHYDHMDWLGNDLADIAMAKAGILRPQQTAIVAQCAQHPTLLSRTNQIAAKCLIEGSDYPLLEPEELPDSIMPSNFTAAVMAMQAAYPACYDDSAVLSKACTLLSLPARLQTLQQTPSIIVDVAHNQQSVERLMSYLQAHPVAGQTHFAWSSLADKPLDAITALGKNICSHWHVAQMNNPRAAGMIDLKEPLMQSNQCYTPYLSPIDCYTSAIKIVTPTDRLVVFGSFPWVGDFIAYWQEQKINDNLV